MTSFYVPAKTFTNPLGATVGAGAVIVRRIVSVPDGREKLNDYHEGIGETVALCSGLTGNSSNSAQRNIVFQQVIAKPGSADRYVWHDAVPVVFDTSGCSAQTQYFASQKSTIYTYVQCHLERGSKQSETLSTLNSSVYSNGDSASASVSKTVIVGAHDIMLNASLDSSTNWATSDLNGVGAASIADFYFTANSPCNAQVAFTATIQGTPSSGSLSGYEIRIFKYEQDSNSLNLIFYEAGQASVDVKKQVLLVPGRYLFEAYAPIGNFGSSSAHVIATLQATAS